MNAVRFLGSLFFDFRAILKKRKPANAASRAAAPAVIKTAVAEVEPPPVVAKALEAKASAAFEHAPVTAQPTAAKEFRTLEEMRADLAHLRATSKERHAQMQAKRNISFAPTDFLDFAEPASPARDKVEENFAPTAYLDFVSLEAPQPADH